MDEYGILQKWLAKSPELLPGILESIADGIVVADMSGKMILFTGVAKRMLGVGRSEKTGEAWAKEYGVFKADRVTPFQTDEIPLVRALRGESQIGIEHFIRNQHIPEGIFISVTGGPLKNASGTQVGAIVAIHDITNLKKLEGERTKSSIQLNQASKLASVGTLSSGVAHELNNPLVAVKGFAQLIESSSDASPKIKLEAQKIVNAATRMQKITDHLRTFSRLSKLEDWKLICIKDPISDSLILLEQQLLYRAVSVELALEPNLPLIWGDHNNLQSIFLNLITNSRDAFKAIDDGRRKVIRITAKGDGANGVKLVYEDNAGGIPESIKAHLFEAFLTTKPAGVGTGLGMSLIKQVLDEHSANVEVESKQGEGTVFTLTFPPDRRGGINSGTRQAAGTPPFAESPAGSKPRILILDDQPDIAELLTCFLQDDFVGHCFGGADSAIEDLKERKYDLVLTDLNMPGGSGIKVLMSVLAIQPGTPVVIMSGYGAEEKEIQYALTAGAKAVLKKPFESAAAVRKCLKDVLLQSKSLNTSKPGEN